MNDKEKLKHHRAKANLYYGLFKDLIIKLGDLEEYVGESIEFARHGITATLENSFSSGCETGRLEVLVVVKGLLDKIK